MPRTVAINDASFHVVDEGSGPPLLLVHGFPLDHTMWRHQIAKFKGTYRVIAPDLRGFGQSSVSPGTVSMKQFADDLAAILPAIGENQPVIFCGLSMGGYIAWQFAEHHRSKLAALIVCDTKAAADTPEAKKARLESAEKLEREGTSFLANTMLPKLFGDAGQQSAPVRGGNRHGYPEDRPPRLCRRPARHGRAARLPAEAGEDRRPHAGAVR